ncbi:MAG: hypothetical protein EA394_03905 [Bacteroidia bacterium]|nr:MAG: hypothetical protein EA394_03905 [Bacteroidia bacterium]
MAITTVFFSSKKAFFLYQEGFRGCNLDLPEAGSPFGSFQFLRGRGTSSLRSNWKLPRCNCFPPEASLL